MSIIDELPTIDGVVETVLVSTPGVPPDAAPKLLIEVPHGATRRSDFEATRRRLRSALPSGLEEFFFVNTDAGASECAVAVARRFTEGRPGSALVLRGLVPRTFIDCNRILGAAKAPGTGLTPAIPDYIREPDDLRFLEGLYQRYQEVASKAYERVCGHGGIALILHTYAPRSVGIDKIDDTIVERLREAYRPEIYPTWPERPPVDVIIADREGNCLAPPRIVESIRERFSELGIAVAENATYRLERETAGYVRSASYPGRVICLEIRRDLLAEPFTPFSEMRIDSGKALRMAGPIAAALLLGTRSEPPV